jgi:hypothetical protein
MKIMVSPVRIRVPPLTKVLQIEEEERVPAALLRLLFRGVSTAGSRKCASSAAVAASCMPSVALVYVARVILLSE